MIAIILFGTLTAVLNLLNGCAGTPVPIHTGIQQSGVIPRAAPVPKTPNCVSSYVHPVQDAQHGSVPIDREGQSAAAAQNIIREILQTEDRMEILGDIPGYIHAVQYSPFWKFPDDVEFWFPEEEDVIHFRSAARLGIGDFGVNRKRMEHLRSRYIVFPNL